MSRKVLFFGDFGIDDTISLIYCILSPEIDLVGVCATYGNVPLSTSIQNAKYILKIANLQIPLFVGPNKPLNGSEPTYTLNIHGQYGLGPLNAPNVFYPLFSFDKVLELVDQFGNELYIISVGPQTPLSLTDILNTSLNKVNRIYIMGGAFLVPGNITRVSEFNFWSDPMAANIVTTKAEGITIIPLNVTMKALINQDLINTVTATTYNPYTPIIKAILEYYLEQALELYPGFIGTPIHDLLAPISLVKPNMFKVIYRQIEVITEGFAIGQSIADLRPGSGLEVKTNYPQIVVDIDLKQFYSEFLQVLTMPLH